MARTHRSLRPRLWSLTLVSTLVALLAVPALAPAASAQAAVDIGINEDRVGTSDGFDVGVVIDFSSGSVQVDAGTYTLRVAGVLNGF